MFMTNKIDCMYKLVKTFETAITMVDENWEITPEWIELINKSEMDITQKTENIFKIYRMYESQIELMKDEKAYINKKQNILKKNIEKLRELISMWLDTIMPEVDKKWKKTQSIKTLKWTAFYSFKEEIEYKKEEIEEKYIIKKTKIRLSDNFSIEKLKEIAPEMVEEVEYEEIDYELLKFDYERAISNNSNNENQEILPPKWIYKEEQKTLSIRK